MSLTTLRNRFVPITLGILIVVLLIGWSAGQRQDRRPLSTPTTTLQVTPRAVATDRAPVSTASGSRSAASGKTIAYDDLPSGGRRTLYLIDEGGPYPYRQDNSIYQNRNRALPSRVRGYYREYTVKTPDSPDRGARRIIVGQDGTAYYTADHYDTFRRVLR